MTLWKLNKNSVKSIGSRARFLRSSGQRDKKNELQNTIYARQYELLGEIEDKIISESKDAPQEDIRDVPRVLSCFRRSSRRVRSV